MKSSIFVFAFFILTCQSAARKNARKIDIMDSWRSEQFVPYIKECLDKLNLLFPIRSSYQKTLSRNQVCRPQGLTTILADKEIQDFESFMNRFAPIKWYLERIDAKQIIKNWTYLVETKMWRARHEHTKKIIEQLFNENHGCDLNQKLEDLQLL